MTPAIDTTGLSGEKGFSLVEAAITLVVLALLLGALTTTASIAFASRDRAAAREALTEEAALAMRRIVTAVGDAPALMLPITDDPATGRSESLREQSVPPVAGSEDRSAVLALRLGAGIDRDADGVPDADNDGDGRIDEDPGQDMTNDSEPGIRGIDDDHDGSTDEGWFSWSDDDDDEDGPDNEDPQGGGDDDADLSVDEDAPSDLNDDGAPGIAGVDDDGDGNVDEGSNSDDDEDGATDEDWYDPVVFYLDGDTLVERQPFPHDFTGNGSITGADFVEAVVAENVTYFRVERIEGARAVLVDVTLALAEPGGQTVRLNTRVRVGGQT